MYAERNDSTISSKACLQIIYQFQYKETGFFHYTYRWKHIKQCNSIIVAYINASMYACIRYMCIVHVCVCIQFFLCSFFVSIAFFSSIDCSLFELMICLRFQLAKNCSAVEMLFFLLIYFVF